MVDASWGSSFKGGTLYWRMIHAWGSISALYQLLSSSSSKLLVAEFPVPPSGTTPTEIPRHLDYVCVSLGNKSMERLG